MSLHFIFGRAGTGKTTRCCREIQDYLKKTPGGRAYLLVPDQHLYSGVPARQVLPRRRLHRCDGVRLLAPCLPRFSRAALAGRRCPFAAGPADHPAPLLTAHKDELQVILRAASQPHFSEKLTAFFHQLDMFLVTEDDLLAASKREGETPLGKKLADLSLLYKAYHDYLRMHFAYEGSLFDLLAREIPKSEKLRGSHIWIDGFNGMAPQKIRIVSALVHTAEEVTMTLQMDSPEEAAENPNFARPYQLYSQLQGAIRHSSSIVLTEEKRFRTSDLSLMHAISLNATHAPALRTGARRRGSTSSPQKARRKKWISFHAPSHRSSETRAFATVTSSSSRVRRKTTAISLPAPLPLTASPASSMRSIP